MEIKNEGYLQEIAFNYNGEKMAICSSFQEIRIYYKKKLLKCNFQMFYFLKKGEKII